MKKLFSIFLSLVTTVTSLFCLPLTQAIAAEPVICFDFENQPDGLTLHNANIVYDYEKSSNVLWLNGDESYAEFEQGFFDNRDVMTISMDVLSEKSDDNFFTFTYGKDDEKYNFLRVRGTAVRCAVTTTGNESEKEVFRDFVKPYEWHNITLVIDNTIIKMYVDGELTTDYQTADTGIKTSDLGENLRAYLGKSFYSADQYFIGLFDNIKVYDCALTDEEVISAVSDNLYIANSVVIGTLNSDAGITLPWEYQLDGTDNHTAVYAEIDHSNDCITSYVRKGTDLSSVPVKFDSALIDNAIITVDGEPFKNGDSLNLNYDRNIKITYNGRVESYTLCIPVFSYNPVLPGQYADPDIDYFDDKYWIYPTTDGKYWWTADVFHAFSSENLVDWTDEGIILDTRSDAEPSVNDNGIEIAISPWSEGESAWAPTIEKKNGKYYFYYVARIRNDLLETYGVQYHDDNTDKDVWWDRAIGVAVADSPVGPFVAEEKPVAYPKLYASLIDDYKGEQIDPAIFTDDDGTSYLLTGGSCVAFMAKLNDDMTTVVNSTVRVVKGMEDFLESFYIFKRDGLYHFTWSCYGTNNENYTVKYATAKSLDPDTPEGELKNTRVLLTKNVESDILCTAHQSFVYRKDIDECIIAYHRFFMPLSNYPTGLGFHRETCIEKVEFDGVSGLINEVLPSMLGAGTIDASEFVINIENNDDTFLYNGKYITPNFIVTDKAGNTISDTCYTYEYSNNRFPTTSASINVTFSGNIKGTLTKKFSIVKELPTEPESETTTQSQPTTVTTTQTQIDTPASTTQATVTQPQITSPASSSRPSGESSAQLSTTAVQRLPNDSQTTTVLPTENSNNSVNQSEKASATTTAKSTTASSTNKVKKAKITKLSKGKKQFKVIWKKMTGVTGYQIQYSTDKKFKKGVKKVTIKKSKVTSATVKKLKSNKKYYVRIRAFKTVKVKSKKTTVYGSWSAVKSVKTK